MPPKSRAYCDAVWKWFGPPLALVRDLSGQGVGGCHQQVMPSIDLNLPLSFAERGHQAVEKHHTKLTVLLQHLKVRPAFRSLRHNLLRYTKTSSSPLPPLKSNCFSPPPNNPRVWILLENDEIHASLLAGGLWVRFAGRVFSVRPAQPGALSPLSHGGHGWLLGSGGDGFGPPSISHSGETIVRHLTRVVENENWLLPLSVLKNRHPCLTNCATCTHLAAVAFASVFRS